MMNMDGEIFEIDFIQKVLSFYDKTAKNKFDATKNR